MTEMKDSGVEWIGEIPKNWDRVSLLRVLRQSITDGPHETPNYVEEGIPFVSVDSIGETERVNLSNVKKYISESDYENYNRKTNLTDGDILFTKSATIGKTAIVDTRDKYMVWSPLAVIKPNYTLIDNKYLYYQFNSDKYIEHATLLGTSNTQVNVGMRTLEKSMIVLPATLEQQKKIAIYLDQKVAHIDNILEKNKQSIEEYKKYKQSLITEVVTKGLDKNVKMKDSGIEWIGEIPEHWEKSKLKYKLSLSTGLSITKADFVEDGVCCLNYGDIHSRYNFDIDLKRDLLKFAPLEMVELKSNVFVNERDFVFCDTSEDLEGSGNCVFIKNLCDELLVAGSHTIIGRPNDSVYSPYFAYLLKSDPIRAQIRSRVIGIKVYSITQKILNNVEFYMPSIDEQIEISIFLDVIRNRIDDLIFKKYKLIEELETYKKSLIYEVVTGKKEIN